MYTIVMDTLNMLMDGLRATLPYSVALWLLASMYRSTRARRQRPSLRQLVIICYAMLLLWGTCFSRVHSVREFFNWSRRDFSGFFVNEFSLTSRTAIWHELMNVLLFVPLGFFCASYMRPERGAWVFALMGFALSCTAESFQGFARAGIRYRRRNYKHAGCLFRMSGLQAVCAQGSRACGYGCTGTWRVCPAALE